MKISWQAQEDKWRRELLSHATGNVLEVEAGTGNNFKYYPEGVTITATDTSARMIDKAKVEAEARELKTRFISSSIEDLEFEQHYKRTGTHIDRDMLMLISASRLRIKKVEVKYVGIVYLVWATLRPAMISDEVIKRKFLHG